MSWVADWLPSNYFKRPAGECSYIDQSAELYGELEIGRFTIIGARCILVAHSPIKIGSFCRLSDLVRCVTHEQHHSKLPSTFMFGDVFDLKWSQGCGAIGMSHGREVTESFPITIGNDVTLGHGVHVFGGVTIGDGCIVRAGSLVNRDCLPYGIYEGTPARLVGMRFADCVVRDLLALKWWNWSVEEIRRNAKFFETDLHDAEKFNVQTIHT